MPRTVRVFHTFQSGFCFPLFSQSPFSCYFDLSRIFLDLINAFSIDRWLSFLDPTLKHCNWSVAEDRIVLDCHSRLGSRWAEIANQLPGRSHRAVMMRFDVLRRRAKRGGQPKSSSASYSLPPIDADSATWDDLTHDESVPGETEPHLDIPVSSVNTVNSGSVVPSSPSSPPSSTIPVFSSSSACQSDADADDLPAKVEDWKSNHVLSALRFQGHGRLKPAFLAITLATFAENLVTGADLLGIAQDASVLEDILPPHTNKLMRLQLFNVIQKICSHHSNIHQNQ